MPQRLVRPNCSCEVDHDGENEIQIELFQLHQGTLLSVSLKHSNNN